MFDGGEIVRLDDHRDYYSEKDGIPKGDPTRTVSRSDLMEIAYSPKGWKEGSGKVVTRGMARGSLLDCLLLTPELFEKQYVVAPEEYQTGGETKKWNRNAKVCKAWHAENPGEDPPETYTTATETKKWNSGSNTCEAWIQEFAKGREVITGRDHAKASAAAASLRSRPMYGRNYTLGELLDACETQVMVRSTWCADNWEIPICGLMDVALLASGIVYDLKSAEDPSPLGFQRACRKYQYETQHALYSDMVEAATGSPVTFGFLAVNADREPYLSGLYELDPEVVAKGREFYERAIRLYCRCLARKEWPDFTPRGFQTLDYNPQAFPDHD